MKIDDGVEFDSEATTIARTFTETDNPGRHTLNRGCNNASRWQVPNLELNIG